MNYWIFKANPTIYDFDEHMRVGDPPAYWKVSRYKEEYEPGDMVFIWRAGIPRGIMAIAVITSKCWYMPYDPKDSIWSGQYKVSIKVTDYFPTILSDYLKTITGLELLSTFHGYQAISNLRVSLKEGEIISRIIKHR